MNRPLLVGLLLVVGGIAFLPSRPPLAAGAGAGPTAKVPNVTVIRSAVLGGHAEDITYISSGRYKGFVAMKVGQEVLGARLTGSGHEPVKLFDLAAAGYLPFRPTGLVHWPDRDRFVVNNHAGVRPGWTEYMYVFDGNGRLERWPVVRQELLGPTYSEGLAYIPSDSPGWTNEWRGRFLMVAYDNTSGANPRIEVLAAANGTFTVERRIPLLPPDITTWADVAPLPSGDLLLTRFSDCNIYRWNPADPDVFSPEPVTPCDLSGEGITVLPDSGVVVSSNPPALRLVTFPPTPPGGPWSGVGTRDLRVGFGISFPAGLAWDSTRQQFLMRYTTSINYYPQPNALAAFPLSLSEWTPVCVLSDRPDRLDRNFAGMTYDGVLDAAVIARQGRAVEHFPAGSPPWWAQTRTPALLDVPLASPDLPTATVELASTIQGLGLYNPRLWTNGPFAVTFLSDEGRYAVGFNGGGNRIYVLEPDLTVNREIDLSASCSDPAMTFGYSQFAATPEPVAGARFVALGSCSKGSSMPADVGPLILAFVDANGNGLFQVDVFRDLGLMRSASHVTFVTSGPHAGAVAVLDFDFHRLVVFQVNSSATRQSR